jgi:hypothetical protein
LSLGIPGLPGSRSFQSAIEDPPFSPSDARERSRSPRSPSLTVRDSGIRKSPDANEILPPGWKWTKETSALAQAQMKREVSPPPSKRAQSPPPRNSIRQSGSLSRLGGGNRTPPAQNGGALPAELLRDLKQPAYSSVLNDIQNGGPPLHRTTSPSPSGRPRRLHKSTSPQVDQIDEK